MYVGLGLGVYFDIPTSYTNTTFSWLIWQQGESWKGEPRTCGHYPPSIWGVYKLFCKAGVVLKADVMVLGFGAMFQS